MARVAPPQVRQPSKRCARKLFSFSINGAPLDNWAGAISVAAGYEYREEHYSQRADPYGAGISASTPATVNEPCTDPFIDCGQTSLGSLGAYSAGNYHNGRGTYHVNEAFVDLGIPILDDGFWAVARWISNWPAVMPAIRRPVTPAALPGRRA